MKDFVRQAGETLGWANVALDARFEATTERIVFPAPVDVLADIEVGKAVAVKIGKGRAGGPETFGQAGLLRGLDKAPPAFAVRHILIKRHAAPAGHEQVRPAVAIVVRSRRPVAIE